MEAPTIQSISVKYKPLKDISKYRDVCGIYQKHDPVVGYYMIYLMATKLNEFYKNNSQCEDIKIVLSQLLTILKQQKTNIDISDPEQSKQRVEDFVNQQFLEADALVEKKQADNETIHLCLNIAYLIDVLEAVSALNDQWINRRKYIKHRAIELSKNLKTYGDVNGPPEPKPDPNARPSGGYNPPQNQGPPANNYNQYNQTTPVYNSPPTHGNTGNVYSSAFNSTNLEGNLMSTLESKLKTGKSGILKETINLNDIFSTVSQQMVGGGGNPEGDAKSFMNSTMYKNNITEFVKVGKSMESDLKSAMSDLDSSNIAGAYMKLVDIRQRMWAILE